MPALLLAVIGVALAYISVKTLMELIDGIYVGAIEITFGVAKTLFFLIMAYGCLIFAAYIF